MSGKLIVVASPEAARSDWVDREIATWLAEHPATTIILVLVEGELKWADDGSGWDLAASTALPRALLTAFTDEPLWVDMRGVDGDNEQFTDRVVTVAAAITGIRKDKMIGLHVRQQRRTVRHVGVAGAVGVVLLVGAPIATFLLNQQTTATTAGRLAAASESHLGTDLGLVNRWRCRPTAHRPLHRPGRHCSERSARPRRSLPTCPRGRGHGSSRRHGLACHSGGHAIGRCRSVGRRAARADRAAGWAGRLDRDQRGRFGDRNGRRFHRDAVGRGTIACRRHTRRPPTQPGGGHPVRTPRAVPGHVHVLHVLEPPAGHPRHRRRPGVHEPFHRRQWIVVRDGRGGRQRTGPASQDGKWERRSVARSCYAARPTSASTSRSPRSRPTGGISASPTVPRTSRLGRRRRRFRHHDESALRACAGGQP